MVSPEGTLQRLSPYLPRLGLASLVICICSGIVLSFYYRPFGNVFQNVEEITSVVPFGWFFRNLHYASGQAFVFLMLIHGADHFLKKRFKGYPFLDWLAIVASVCICLFALFTGFILKGDKEGVFAGNILMNLVKSIPVHGPWISRLLIRPGDEFFFLPFIYHCILLPCLILFLLQRHIREWIPGMKFMYVAGVSLFAYSTFAPLPQDVPPAASVGLVKGPWFFLGIQTLLKFISPLWGAIIIPGIFLAFTLALPKTRGLPSIIIYYTVILSALIYFGLIVRALTFTP